MAKGPKTLNPADKARKEARKKEIKKNRKQRQQVRSAVIESKDPEQILADLESLDKLVYDINHIGDADREPGGSSDIIFREKRRRLKELWLKVTLYYQKEDQEKYNHLKKLETQYEDNHARIEREFDAIKAAQEATIDDVILPPEPEIPENLDEGIPDDDPLMSESVYITPFTEGTLKPPGCPPGPPPDFQQLVDCLRSSLAAPPTLIAQTIPKNLLHIKPNKPGLRNQHRQKGWAQGRSGAKFHPNKPEGQITGDSSKPKQPRTEKTSVESPESQSKGAVIESKPVFFMQKVTKFVPASVRSKLKKGGDK